MGGLDLRRTGETVSTKKLKEFTSISPGLSPIDESPYVQRNSQNQHALAKKTTSYGTSDF